MAPVASSISISSVKPEEDSEVKITKNDDYWTTVLFVDEPRELCIKCRLPWNSLYGKALEWVGPLHHHHFTLHSFHHCNPIIFFLFTFLFIFYFIIFILTHKSIRIYLFWDQKNINFLISIIGQTYFSFCRREVIKLLFAIYRLNYLS